MEGERKRQSSALKKLKEERGFFTAGRRYPPSDESTRALLAIRSTAIKDYKEAQSKKGH